MANDTKGRQQNGQPQQQQKPADPPAAPVPEKEADVAAVTSDIVTVTSPKAFKMRVDHSTLVEVKQGVQQMSRSLAGHWYAVANGVVVYDPVASAKQALEKAEAEAEVARKRVEEAAANVAGTAK